MVKRIYLGGLFRGDEFDDHRLSATTPGRPPQIPRESSRNRRPTALLTGPAGTPPPQSI